MNELRSGMCKLKLACHLLGDLLPPAEFIFSSNLKHLLLISLGLIRIRFVELFNNFRLSFIIIIFFYNTTLEKSCFTR